MKTATCAVSGCRHKQFSCGNVGTTKPLWRHLEWAHPSVYMLTEDYRRKKVKELAGKEEEKEEEKVEDKVWRKNTLSLFYSITDSGVLHVIGCNSAHWSCYISRHARPLDYQIPTPISYSGRQRTSGCFQVPKSYCYADHSRFREKHNNEAIFWRLEGYKGDLHLLYSSYTEVIDK